MIRIIPTLDNNFYFTMDQGNDAVHIREIIYRHQILLLGPETGLKNLYAGPLWYYFAGLGFALWRGHPFGGVFMIIILNIVLTAIIMRKVAKNVSRTAALIIGASLQTSWWFYDTSRYAFNPFPLVFLGFMLIFLLIDFLAGDRKRFVLAAIAVGLGFHTEVAGSIAFSLFYLTVGIYFFLRRKISGKILCLGLLVLCLFLLPYLISELSSGFLQTFTLLREIKNPHGVFSATQFSRITRNFFLVISRSIIRQIPELGVFIVTLITFLIYKQGKLNPKINRFIIHFVTLTFILLGISWLWFSSNKGWHDWQTVYLSPIIFVAVLLMLWGIPRKIAIAIFILTLISHLTIFKTRYLEYLHPSHDASILKNELGAIDWVYQKSDGKGFYVYSYLPSVYDYPYQYLFWWYGIKKYGYVPCEYSSFPTSLDDLIIPGWKYYQTPKRKCDNLRFLIIEPDEREILKNQWFKVLSRDTKLISSSYIGKIRVEKREILRP